MTQAAGSSSGIAQRMPQPMAVEALGGDAAPASDGSTHSTGNADVTRLAATNAAPPISEHGGGPASVDTADGTTSPAPLGQDQFSQAGDQLPPDEPKTAADVPALQITTDEAERAETAPPARSEEFGESGRRGDNAKDTDADGTGDAGFGEHQAVPVASGTTGSGVPRSVEQPSSNANTSSTGAAAGQSLTEIVAASTQPAGEAEGVPGTVRPPAPLADDATGSARNDAGGAALGQANGRADVVRPDATGGGHSNERPHVDPAEFASRLAAALNTARDSGRQLRIRLHPPELGSLSVEVTAREGALFARLDVESRAAQRVVLEHIGQLREILTQQGTPVERIDVHIDHRAADGSVPDFAGGFEGESHAERRNPHRPRAAPDAPRDDDAPRLPPRPNRARLDRLDIRV